LLLFHSGLRWLDSAFLSGLEQSGVKPPPPNYFTGSYPPAQNGWQRSNRQIASPVPRTAPCFSIASRAYSEQVGTKRQDGGNHGEITAL